MSDGYLGNDNLKRIGVELQYTEEQVKEILKCSEDPVYFIKTYMKLIDKYDQINLLFLLKFIYYYLNTSSFS